MSGKLGTWLRRGTARNAQDIALAEEMKAMTSALQGLALSHTSAIRFAEKQIERADRDALGLQEACEALQSQLEAVAANEPGHARERYPYTTRCGNCGWEVGTTDPHKAHWNDQHRGAQFPIAPAQTLTALLQQEEGAAPIGPADSMAIAGYTLAEVLGWLFGSDDAGLSSETIFQQMVLGSVLEPWPPSDGGDFRRCYRLLERFPLWRHRLNEMCGYPGWAPLIAIWAELEQFCRLADSADDASERRARYAILDHRITQLRRETKNQGED